MQTQTMPITTIGMQATAIYIVAHDWRTESVGMRRVQSQLMRATRDGSKQDAGMAVLNAYNLVLGYGTLAISGNHLTRTVVVVEPHRQIYHSSLFGHHTLEQSHIALLHRATDKLLLQGAMRRFTLRHNEDS